MRRSTVPIALALAVLLTAVAASGEIVQRGTLRVSFDGKLSPRALPRDRPAPVSVLLDGSIGTADGSRPPQLRTISIAVNRNGRLFLEGLPVCPIQLLEQSSTEAALLACGGALVGHGRFGVNLDFPNATSIPAIGKVRAFNGRFRGNPALLLHIYVSSPARATFVLPFEVRRPGKGDFGTVFSARIPQIASDLGYVTDIELTIGRKYHFAGEPRSFLSASCSAPVGFPGAPFKLAKATFGFANGQRVTMALARNCKVR
jgi:hypothetical protein